jgi:hypothetical protein
MTITHTRPAQYGRNLEVAQLHRMVSDISAASVDLNIPASRLAFHDGQLELANVEPVLTDTGVADLNGRFDLTHTAVGHLGGIADIPPRYLRTCLATNVPLFDENLNSWMAHGKLSEKNVLVRILTGLDAENPAIIGQARAFLSDRFDGSKDNLPLLLAVLDGIRQAGIAADQLDIKGDLTEDRMYMIVRAPEITGYAHDLLKGYVSPYANGRGTAHGGLDAENLPIIEAGLLIQNSETGGAALKITPRVVVRACSNGLQQTVDSMRQVHLGAKLNEGQVEWSRDTRRAANELARSQATDAVKSFLNVSYVEKVIERMTEDAVTPIREVKKVIEFVAKDQNYTEAEADSILNFFIDGGQRTAGGVMQAITAAVQQIEDPQRAYDIEATAVDAMKVAARVAREEVMA